MNKLDITNVSEDEKHKNIDEFICRICSFILQDPHECENCGIPYCKDCLEAWHQRSSQCPIKCGSTLKIKPAHRFFKKMLGEIKIKCPNENCPEIIQISRLEYHLKECQFLIVKCNNEDCDENYLRKDLVKHMETCKFKEFFCIRCNEKIKIRPGVGCNNINNNNDINNLSNNNLINISCDKLQVINIYDDHDCIKVLSTKIKSITNNLETVIKQNEIYDKSIKELKDKTNLLMSNISYKCDNAHPLIFKATWTSTCSCCGLIKICTRWECSSCKKNYCLDCIKLLNFVFCPNYHTFLYGDRGNFLCDFCGAKKTQGGPLSLHDPVCDFDVCDTCVLKLFPNINNK
jgi:hypothetical protein